MTMIMSWNPFSIWWNISLYLSPIKLAISNLINKYFPDESIYNDQSMKNNLPIKEYEAIKLKIFIFHFLSIGLFNIKFWTTALCPDNSLYIFVL